MFRVVQLDIDKVTNNLVYIIEDDINHANMWNSHTCIRDNGTISIGTVVRLFCPKPYENVMPDGIPSIETRFPLAVMKTPSYWPEVMIDYQVKGGDAIAFCLNGCEIESMQVTPEETGCAGKFCDKQRVIEVRQYNEGCGCYSYNSRRSSIVVDHTINVKHHSLQEENMYVSNFSSLKFSLLYQTGCFNLQVRITALEDMTAAYFNLEDSIKKMIELVNENGGFTVIGWLKNGKIKDKTILFQLNNDEAKKFTNGNDEKDTVDNSKINFHPCIVKPTNPDFFDSQNELFAELNALKFDVGSLLHA